MIELIINGQAVDLGAGAESITLEYVNNLLTKPDEISSSHSYTIELPRTLKNDRILDLASDSTHRSSAVGTFLPAEYRRNGFTLTKNAKAFISGVSSSTISVVLVWDAFAPFQEWLQSDKNIAQISRNNPVWYGQSTFWSYILQNYPQNVQAKINSGARERTVIALPLYRLVKDIMDGTGAKWVLPYDDIKADANTLAVPCFTNVGGWNTIACKYYTRAYWYDDGVLLPLYAAPSSLDDISSADHKQIPISGTGIKTLRITFANMEVQMRGNIISNGKIRVFGVDASNDVNTLAEFSLLPKADNKFTITGTAEVNVEDYDHVYFWLNGTTQSTGLEYGDIYSTSTAGELLIETETESSGIGKTYHIEKNAPEISQVDIIKAFCAIYGLALVTNASGQLAFARLDDVLTDIHSRAYDWTDKVVNPDSEKHQYTIEGYAIHNYLRWKEDNENDLNADAEILSGSETLDKEVTIAELPFAPSKDVVNFETYDESKEEYTNESVEPRLMRLAEDTTATDRTIIKGDDTLNFTQIVASRYKLLSRLLEYPVQSRVFIRLSEGDLAQLDMTRPVYLAQKGAYYIIKSVQTDESTDICEVNLIKL